MSAAARDIGVVGLGVMGANLARNLASRGHRVAGTDRDPQAASRLAAAHPESGIEAFSGVQALVAALERPRRVLVMVPAGPPLEQQVDAPVVSQPRHPQEGQQVPVPVSVDVAPGLHSDRSSSLIDNGQKLVSHIDPILPGFTLTVLH